MPFGPIWPGQGRLQQLFGPSPAPSAPPQNIMAPQAVTSDGTIDAQAPVALPSVPASRADDLADLRRELELLKRSVKKGRA
jgi:hypothetical protein